MLALQENEAVTEPCGDIGSFISGVRHTNNQESPSSIMGRSLTVIDRPGVDSEVNSLQAVTKVQDMLIRAIARLRQMDWRIFMGIIITVLWIIAGIVYLRGGNFSQATIYDIPLENIGSFLEGAFAPLAFLWLVIGLFVQQRELADNTEVLRQTSIQSEKQTQAIAATEMNARQETYFKIAEGVRHQLGGISGMLLMSGVGPVGSGRINREQMDSLFSQAANGDSAVFARQFISLEFAEEGGLAELLYGTDIRARHTRNYRRTFERLCRLANNCDVDGIIEDSLMQTALGLLYRRMVELAPDNDQAT